MRKSLFHHNQIRRDRRGFVYVNDLKIARYIEERRTIEFKGHGKDNPVVEVAIDELTEGLKRLCEAANPSS